MLKDTRLVTDKNYWIVAEFIMKKFVGKPWNDAYSYASTYSGTGLLWLKSKLKEHAKNPHWAHLHYCVDDDGIIRRKKEVSRKLKRPTKPQPEIIKEIEIDGCPARYALVDNPNCPSQLLLVLEVHKSYYTKKGWSVQFNAIDKNIYTIKRYYYDVKFNPAKVIGVISKSWSDNKRKKKIDKMLHNSSMPTFLIERCSKQE